MNTCWAPRLEMSPKCFLMATVALISAFPADPLSLVGAGISIFFVATKLLSWQTCLSYFCHDKSMLVATKLLSWQTAFVMTKVCLLLQNFCHDKHMFVTTSICRDKTLVTTNIILLWQAYFCHDKRHVLCLSRQAHVSCNKTFVATKILEAAPANENPLYSNRMRLWLSDCSFTQCIWKIHQSHSSAA